MDLVISAFALQTVGIRPFFSTCVSNFVSHFSSVSSIPHLDRLPNFLELLGPGEKIPALIETSIYSFFNVEDT